MVAAKGTSEYELVPVVGDEIWDSDGQTDRQTTGCPPPLIIPAFPVSETVIRRNIYRYFSLRTQFDSKMSTPDFCPTPGSG